MRVYIVTKNDYRYVNGRFFPVNTFGADIKCALNHMNIFVGVYDSFSAADAVVDEDIRVHFNINEVIDNYKSSIRIEKHYYDSHWKEIDVIVPDSDGLNQIQMIYNIAIKDFEVPVDDDKKGIQLKDLKSEDIDSIAEEAAEKLSESEKADEDNEYAADECYIDNDTIDFVGPGNRRTSAQVSKDYDEETYNEDLLYELAEATDIFTHFYDIRERKPGKNLVLELTGVQPIRDNYDPDNTTWVKAYCTDAVKERKCVYEVKYPMMLSDISYNIIFNFLNFADDNLNLSEYDNLYIVDERVHPVEKESSKEEKDHNKAIECTISTSNYNNDNTLLVFKFKIDGTCRTKSLSKVATNTEDFIRYLKQYTDSHTKFIDERVGLSWITFYSRISYDCHIIEMDADTIILKHYNLSNGTIDISFKNERKYFEFVLDHIKDANIIYIRDETAW